MDWQLFGTILIQIVLAALMFCVLSFPIGFGILMIRRGIKQNPNTDSHIFYGRRNDSD